MNRLVELSPEIQHFKITSRNRAVNQCHNNNGQYAEYDQKNMIVSSSGEM